MKELASRIGSLFLGQPIMAALPILGKGRINQIFAVKGETQEIVLRINDLLNASDALEEYAKEQWCLEQAAATGVPSPSVLTIGQSEGHAYMVQSYVPGDNAEDSSADRTAIWQELGRYTRLIHRIDITGEDRRRPEPPGSLFGALSAATAGDWLRDVQEGIDAVYSVGDPLEGPIYPRSQKGAIVARLEALRTLPFRPGLNHGDLSLKNALVDQTGRVSLLDWGSALVHATPHYDLSQMLKKQVESGDPDDEQISAFLGGYGLSATDALKIRAQSADLLLLRALAKARWALACQHPKAQSFASLAGRISSVGP